jgi:hypothetical protein
VGREVSAEWRPDLKPVRKSTVIAAALGLRLKEDRGSSRFQQPIRRGIAVKGTAMNVSRQK